MSCSSYQGALDQLPNREFKKFSYSRTGNVTSTSIFAVGAKKTQNGMQVDDIKITHSNPFFGVNAEIEGYVYGLRAD